MKSSSDITNYISPEGIILSYPGKKHRELRFPIYKHLAGKFEVNKIYSEPEINAIIKRWIAFDDYVILRREMIDFGWLHRTDDNRKYWSDGKEGLMELKID